MFARGAFGDGKDVRSVTTVVPELGGGLAQSCATCGTVLTEAAACPACGRRDVVVVPTGPPAVRFERFSPTIIIDGPDAATGDAVIKVSAPGATSETRLSKEGLVSLKVQGAGEIGRRASSGFPVGTSSRS
jgi:hypothetical protein